MTTDENKLPRVILPIVKIMVNQQLSLKKDEYLAVLTENRSKADTNQLDLLEKQINWYNQIILLPTPDSRILNHSKELFLGGAVGFTNTATLKNGLVFMNNFMTSEIPLSLDSNSTEGQKFLGSKIGQKIIFKGNEVLIHKIFPYSRIETYLMKKLNLTYSHS